MGNKLYNLAGVSTTTSGTGTVSLGDALPGLLTFQGSGAQDGDVVSYSILDGDNTEVGVGTFTLSGTTLSRDTVRNSTNSNNKIDLTGSAKVYVTILAEDISPNSGTEYVDQSGGTGDTYGVLVGDIDGNNTQFTVSRGSYISGRLKVYRNGQLQVQGTTTTGNWVETTPASGTFDFNTAPATGDEIMVVYSIVSISGVVDNSTIRGSGTVADPYYAVPSFGEKIDQSNVVGMTYGLLSGSINGVNKVYTVSNGSYLTGRLKVYRNGSMQIQGTTVSGDWSETLPNSGTFTFATAPMTGDLLTAIYGISVLNGIADGKTIIGAGTLADPYYVSPTFKVYMNTNFA
jgi:hypothetical protein